MDLIENQPKAPRSNFVTVLAWVFIVMSGFTTLVSVAQNIMMHFMFSDDMFAQMTASMQADKEKQNIPASAVFMISHMQWFFAAFLGVSAASLVISIALLKRMNWARVLFIWFMAFGIVWNLGGLAWQYATLPSLLSVPPQAPPEFRESFETMARIMTVVSAAIAIGISILFAWIIKRLASVEIKREFGSL